MTTSATAIGFVGLGSMGSAMARNLLAAVKAREAEGALEILRAPSQIVPAVG